MRARHNWRIARLPEENYQAASLGELLEQVVIRSDGIGAASVLRSATNDVQVQERAIDLLRTRASTSKQPLLVVIENLAALFDHQLRSVRDQARLRDILTNNPPFILLATSTSQSDATTRHSAPLFDFFQTLVLDDLDRIEIAELVRARADWERNASLLADFDRVRSRIDAIYHLSGGNPRLALALYRALEHGVTSELHSHIMKLLDEVTPYYQARLNDIPPQAVRILTEMAVSETLATPAAIARRCRMPTNQVTAQISKLLDERLIIQGGRPNARSRYYEFKDRLLRIWIQMRESVGAEKRLRFLAEFFERWYAGRSDELAEASRRALSDFWTDLDGGDERRCGDRLKTLSYLADVRPGFDQSVVLNVMMKHVGQSSEADVREHVDALQRTFQTAPDLREREALAFLLAECYVALRAEENGRRYLRAVLDEGSESEAIVFRYLSALVAEKDFAEAHRFGDSWLNRHPSHKRVAGSLGVAACGIGDIENGLNFVAEFTELGFCAHCVEKVLRRTITTLRDAHASADVEQLFWERLLAPQTNGDAPPSEVKAVLDVLGAAQLSTLSPASLLEAAKPWKPLSGAPGWLLSKAICGLAHRRAYAADTLRFIDAFAERTSTPLSQFAVDHLTEILPELRHSRHKSDSAAKNYATGMALVRKRTTQEALTEAFSYSAPLIAKRFPELTGDLVALYQEWLHDNSIAESITPYAEAVLVLQSEEPDNLLQSFHPETREAVSLLVNLIDRPLNATKGQ
jgi:hypothetical protein